MFFYIFSEWLFSLLDFLTVQTWKWICGLDDLIYLKIFYQFWYTNLSREFSHIHSSSNFYPSRTFTRNNLKIFNTTFSHFYYQISSMKFRSTLFSFTHILTCRPISVRKHRKKKHTIAEKLISKFESFFVEILLFFPSLYPQTLIDSARLSDISTACLSKPEEINWLAKFV